MLSLMPLLLASTVSSTSATTSPTEAAYLGLSSRPTAEGELVVHVEPDGPAAEAGIEVGDVLVRAGDRPLGARRLRAELSRYRPGDTVRLSALTRGGVTERRVRLAARPGPDPLAVRLVAPPSPEPDSKQLYLAAAAIPVGAAVGGLVAVLLPRALLPLVCIRAAGGIDDCSAGPVLPALGKGAAIGAGAGALTAIGLLLYEPDDITHVDGGPEPSSTPGSMSVLPVMMPDAEGEVALGFAVQFGPH